MPISRSYRKQLDDLPEVALPNWDLLEKLWGLFAENAAEEPEATIRGTDRRGSFEAGDLPSFRTEADNREDPLRSVTIENNSTETSGSWRGMQVYFFDRGQVHGSEGTAATADIRSGDEVFVRGIAQRTEELFERAAVSLGEAQARASTDPEPASSQESHPEPPPRRRRFIDSPWAVQVGGGLIVGIILLVLGLGLTLWLTGDSESSGSPSGSSVTLACVIAGQAFDEDGGAVSAAQIVARDPESEYWKQIGGDRTVLTTTDGEGRFEADCEATEKPFIIAVTWEPVMGSGEWCEWWGVRVGTEIEADGQHRGINIQIPVEAVEGGAYPYTDDYGCTYLDRS